MVRGQSWRALSGVAGTRRLLVDMKAAKRPVRAKRMNVHVSNRIFRPDDVTKRQSGWLREILGPEGCPRTCFKTVTKRSNATKNKQSETRTCKLAGKGGRRLGRGPHQTKTQIDSAFVRRVVVAKSHACTAFVAAPTATTIYPVKACRRSGWVCAVG